MNILILGHKGMLGHMVKFFLESQGETVATTEFKFPNEDFKKLILDYQGDYIINCIGAIPQKTNIFDINYDLPAFLDQNAKCKIIHPGTDCEMDHDDYGMSKKKASDYLKEQGIKTKILKCSIIGPELNSKFSLMDWFLNSEGVVHGYSRAMWNGNTTLEWAKNCHHLINNWENYQTETILEGECLSKYDLLQKIKDAFSKKISILAKEDVNLNKCLKGHIRTKDIAEQLKELKETYYNKNK